MDTGQSHWLSVTSSEDRWTWALGDGIPEAGGQSWAGLVSPGGGAPGEPVVPRAHFAFGLWPVLVTESGVLPLLGLGLAALWQAGRRSAG